MRRSSNIIIFLLCSVLCSCSNYDKNAKLQAYIKQIKGRSIKEIEPLPEVKPYETFTYNAFNLRSPFVQSAHKELSKKAGNDNGIRPDVNRRKEALESFTLDSLRMVGTLEKDGKTWALIVDPNGMVHRVTKLNYIGQNDGRIDNITQEKVLLTEIVPDANGGWRERKASIAIVDEDPLHPSKSKQKR